MAITAPITVENIAQAPAQVPFLRRPGPLERTLASVIFFVYAFSLPTEWFVRVTGSSAGTVQGGSPLVTLTFLGFLGFVGIAFNGNWPVALAAAGREPLIPGFVGLIAVSVLWSTNVVETATASIVIGITLMVGLYFSARFSLSEILFLAGIPLAVGVIANFGMIFAFPDVGLDYVNTSGGDPRWSGVFVTKNEFGRTAALSFIVFGFLSRLRRSFFVWPLWTTLALVQVVVADSATSIGAVAAVSALTLVFLGFRGRKTFYGATAVAMTSVFSIATLVGATSLAEVTGLFGKQSNLTGRLPLWLNSWEYGVSERLWTGYGWNSFWTEDESFPVHVRANFDVPHAHNAFLDAWLYAGPIAAVLLLAIFVRGLVWGARNVRAVPTVVGLVPVILVSYAFMFSLTEAGVVRRDISFVLLIVACVTAAKNKGIKQPWSPPGLAEPTK